MGNGKIGIFAPEQHGDIALSTAGLKYKDRLWPNKDVVWFANLAEHKATYLDMLKYNDAISEIRDWPKFSTMEHFWSCIDRSNGHFVQGRFGDFDSTKDLEAGFFPAPWCMLPNNSLNGMTYSEIPRFVFGADTSWEWHPYLGFSEEERTMAKDFCQKLPHKRTVMFETELRSAGMFQLHENTVKSLMGMCRSKFGNCNFIFASKVDHSKYADDAGVVSGSQFTVRQLALVHNNCDLFIGVCSGITMACSCWGSSPIPRVELCGTPIRSSGIAHGPVRSVICDNFSPEQMKAGLENALGTTLNSHF
jgi:hypothetical protein